MCYQTEATNKSSMRLQFEHVLYTHDMDGYIDDTNKQPPQYLESTSSLDPEHVIWKKHVQLLLIWII